MKLISLTFDASPRDTLVYDSDHDPPLSVRGGQSFAVDEDRALELLTCPGIPLKESEIEQELDKLTRHQLDEIAEQIGVENPGEFANKGEVIEAITNHEPSNAQPSLSGPTYVDSDGDAADDQRGE